MLKWKNMNIQKVIQDEQQQQQQQQHVSMLNNDTNKSTSTRTHIYKSTDEN